MPANANLFLDMLSERGGEDLLPHLVEFPLKQHQVLYEVGEVIDRVYFASDAVVSLTIPLSTGEVIETAMVGRDGAVGASAAFDGRVSLHRAVVQVGGNCMCCAVEPLRDVMKRHDGVLSLIGGHQQALLAQAQQSAACNSTHDIESRLARWLLRASDLRGSDDLPLTQEYIAQMLGVRRTSVTLIANVLQRAGMIRYSRGHITLTDITALQDTACECYHTVKMNYEALFRRSNSGQTAR